MNYKIQEISSLVNGALTYQNESLDVIQNIVFDSRKISKAGNSLFVALTSKNDGHNYIQDAYKKGIRNFLISKKIEVYADCNYVLVDDTLDSIQKLAKLHKQKHRLQTIGITGSNGKTIIKEWLSTILYGQYKIVKNPKSYNSQLGVALSVLNIEAHHDLGIFEAGISTLGEMEKLESIIKPDIGIITNIGDAHNIGFKDQAEKLSEKLLLFKDSAVLIYNADDEIISDKVEKQFSEKGLISWGHNENSFLRILSVEKEEHSSQVKLLFEQEIFTVELPFITDIYIQNVMHALCCALFLEVDSGYLKKELLELEAIPLRMETTKARDHSFLINDSYSADLSSFKLALEYLNEKANSRKKQIIISDLEQQKNHKEALMTLAEYINEKAIESVFYVGENQSVLKEALTSTIEFKAFSDTEAFIDEIRKFNFSDSIILIKGARKYRFEKIFKFLEAQVHQTVLEINLSHLAHNIRQYRSLLRPDTKIMAVIKASAYGSGSEELAQHLSAQNVDFLAVAVADEAVEIRKNGIDIPILVFNLQEHAFDLLWEYNLEPEVFSLHQLKTISSYTASKAKELSIHLKLDTGMRRLGFFKEDISEALSIIKENKFLKIASVFSHLSISEDRNMAKHANAQFELFDELYDLISKSIGFKPIKHILNSSGVCNYPDYQYDMVRLGLGMYGINETETPLELKMVNAFKTKILQIKQLRKGEATGYGRHAVAENDMVIAIIGVGYADGLMRLSGNGNYEVKINGIKAPIIGNVCMDVSIIDVTHLKSLSLQDEVIIFDCKEDLFALAKANKTIAYELLSRISKRVNRIYLEE